MNTVDIYRDRARKLAGVCEPGQAVLVMVTRKEGFSAAIGQADEIIDCAMEQVSADDIEVLAVWTVGADGTFTDWQAELARHLDDKGATS